MEASETFFVFLYDDPRLPRPFKSRLTYFVAEVPLRKTMVSCKDPKDHAFWKPGDLVWGGVCRCFYAGEGISWSTNLPKTINTVSKRLKGTNLTNISKHPRRSCFWRKTPALRGGSAMERQRPDLICRRLKTGKTTRRPKFADRGKELGKNEEKTLHPLGSLRSHAYAYSSV